MSDAWEDDPMLRLLSGLPELEPLESSAQDVRLRARAALVRRHHAAARRVNGDGVIGNGVLAAMSIAYLSVSVAQALHLYRSLR